MPAPETASGSHVAMMVCLLQEQLGSVDRDEAVGGDRSRRRSSAQHRLRGVQAEQVEAADRRRSSQLGCGIGGERQG